jgi:hypothetical protein
VVSAGLAVLGLTVLWFAFPERPLGFPLDDAWIHLVYARSLAMDFVLGYEPGVPGTGCTSPGWAVLLGILYAVTGWAGADVVVWGVRFLGAGFFVATVVLSAGFVLACSESRWAALASAGMVAFSSGLAMAAFSGMEVLACSFGMVLALVALVKQAPLIMGCAMAWACACRPEATPAMVLTGLVAFWKMPRSALTMAKLVLPAFLVGALILEHNLRASGHPLPSTFYLKQRFDLSSLPSRLVQVVVDAYGNTGPFVGHVLWFGVFGAISKRSRLPDRLPLVVGCVFLVAAAAVTDPSHGAGFYFDRYFFPAIPLVVAGLALGGRHLLQSCPATVRPWAAAAAGVLVVPGIVVGAFVYSYHLHNDTRNINDVQVRIGQDLAVLMRPGARVAVSDAGAIRYGSNHPAFDLLGLNNLDAVERPAAFVAEHPVTHLAIMPAWGVPAPDSPVRLVRAYETTDYSVVTAEDQRVQWLLECKERGLVRIGATWSALCDPSAHQ